MKIMPIETKRSAGFGLVTIIRGRTLSLLLPAVLFTACADLHRCDQSTPLSTFRSAGLAIKNDDPKMFYRCIEWTHWFFGYRQFLEFLWVEDCAWPRYGVCNGEIPSDKRAAEFFLQADAVWERIGILEKRGRVEHRILLFRWNQGKIFREAEFVREKGGRSWRLMPDPYASEYAFCDLSTPSNAYLFVEQSTSLKVLDDLCAAYATSVKGGLSDKEWVRILSDRLSRLQPERIQGAWEQPQMTSAREDLDVEMQPVQAGGSELKCTVWRLRYDTRKRLFPETFVKEGDQWKWLPKPEYFFLYPNKIESPELKRRMKTPDSSDKK
ncbi:MAG: hypothetical protein HZA91_03195 [Verrucomicrobia bacterium]|nr:hypothetical protein [Verrucomicrobiota bacterium]